MSPVGILALRQIANPLSEHCGPRNFWTRSSGAVGGLSGSYPLSIKPRESGRPRAAFDNNLETFSPVNEDALPLEDLPGKIMLPIRQSYASSDSGDWRHSHVRVLAADAANSRRHFPDRIFKPLRQMQHLACAVIEDGSQLSPEYTCSSFQR
jgi:hypothetical protein